MALCLACGDPTSPEPDATDATTEAVVESPPEPVAADAAFAAEGLEAMTPDVRVGWPVESVHLTSYFGWRVDPVTGQGTRLHRGIDLRGRPGDLVMSIAPGQVSFAGHDSLLGNLVVLDHGMGIESYYGHLTDVLVHAGLLVDRGVAIGLVGNTGRSQAPHLHLSIKIVGVPVDPLAVIRQPLHPLPALARELPSTEDEPEGDTSTP